MKKEVKQDLKLIDSIDENWTVKEHLEEFRRQVREFKKKEEKK